MGIDLTATRKSSSSSTVVQTSPRRDSSTILRLPPSRAALPRLRPSGTSLFPPPTTLPSSLPSPRPTMTTRFTATSELSAPSSTTRAAGTPGLESRPRRRSESFQEHRIASRRTVHLFGSCCRQKLSVSRCPLYSLLGIICRASSSLQPALQVIWQAFYY